MLKRNSIYMRYAITYLLLIIAIFFVTFWMFYSFRENQIQMVRENQGAKVDLLAQELVHQFAQYDEIATLAHMDFSVSRAAFEGVGIIGYEAREELQKYKAKCPNTTELIRWFYNDKVFTTRGYCTLDTFLTGMYHMTQETRIRLKECLSRKEADFCIIETDEQTKKERILYYHRPVPVFGAAKASAVGFLLDTSQIRKNFRKVIGENGAVTLELANNEIIFSEGQSELLEMARSSEKSEFRYKNSEYSIQQYDIGTTGLKCYIMTDMTAATLNVNDVYKAVLIMMCCSMLAFMVVSFLLSYYHYKPIRSIYDKIVPPTVTGFNELDSIHRAFSITNMENDALQKHISESYIIIREQALHMLFEGRRQDEEAAVKMLEYLGFATPFYKYYAVLSLWTDEDTLNRIATSGQFAIHYTQSDNNKNQFCVVLSAADIDELKKVAFETMDSLQKWLTDSVSCFSLGGMYCEPGYVHSSMIESVIAHEKQNGKEFVQFTEKQIFSLGVDEDQYEKIDAFIREHSFKAAADAVHTIIQNIENQTVSRSAVEIVIDKLMQVLMRAFEEDAQLKNSISELMKMNVNNLQEFREDITALFKDLVDETVDCKTDNQRFRLVMSYMMAHYTDPDISADSVARYFGIGRNTLTKMIKVEVGSTYQDLLVSLRIQEAKRLLRETDFSVKEITEQVGYSDVSSFHRKFKQITGMTPSDYRNSRA